MIYLFSGDDVKNRKTAFEKFIKTLSKCTETVFVSRNNFDPMQIESYYSGASLFSTLSAIVFDNILEYQEKRDFLLEKFQQMGESQNTFIFLEGKLAKPILDALKKAGAELNIFEAPKEKTEKFNTFIIANFFEKKDKLNTWIYFRQAIIKEVAPEEIVGVLFWKAKDMLLRKSYGKYSAGQLKDFVAQLSYLLPEARKDGRDVEAALERFLLEIF